MQNQAEEELSDTLSSVADEESLVALYRRRSRRFENAEHVTNNNVEERTPYDIECPSTTLHVYSLLLCIARNMRCKLCRKLFLDSTILTCGHAVCRFCIQKWMSHHSHCPVCGMKEIHPTCVRCYQLDSLLEAVTQVLTQMYQDHEQSALVKRARRTNPSPVGHPGLDNLLQTEEIVRLRRKAGRTPVFTSHFAAKTSLNHSILKGVSDLGYRLRYSFLGFFLLLLGSLFLALAFSCFFDLIDQIQMEVIRRLIYVFLILAFLSAERIPFLRGTDGDRRMFWEQIFTFVQTEEEDATVLNERDRIVKLVLEGKVDINTIQRDARYIFENLNL